EGEMVGRQRQRPPGHQGDLRVHLQRPHGEGPALLRAVPAAHGLPPAPAARYLPDVRHGRGPATSGPEGFVLDQCQLHHLLAVLMAHVNRAGPSAPDAIPLQEVAKTAKVQVTPAVSKDKEGKEMPVHAFQTVEALNQLELEFTGAINPCPQGSAIPPPLMMP